MYFDWPLLGRCCFCMPLRRGVLIFGYIYLFFSAFMVGGYSHSVHNDVEVLGVYHHGTTFELPAELCLTIYLIELIFYAVLIYGAHKKNVTMLKTYYYFSLMTVVATFLIHIIEIITASSGPLRMHLVFEIGPLAFASFCLQIYIIILVRSLIRKLDISATPNVYDNPLQQIVYDGRVEANGVYDTTVVPVNV